MSSHNGEPRDEQSGANEFETADEQAAAAGASVEPADEQITDEVAEFDEDDAAGDLAEPGAAAGRRHLVRQKAKKVTTKQRVRRILVRSGIAVVIIAALVAAGFWIKQNVVPEVTEPVPEPGNIADGAFLFDGQDLSSMLEDSSDEEDAEEEGSDTQDPDDGGSAETEDEEPERVTVDVYVDYLSPESALFHQANAAQLASWVSEDAISLTYHPVALLTAKSNGTRYSQRAMGAAACVASGDPERFVPFNDALLTDQPAVDTPGHTSEELVDIAESVGVENSDVFSCIESDKYATWARDMTTELSDGGLPGQGGQQLTGAPMVLVSGMPYTGALDDPGELSQFVLTVESDEYFQSPTPEPSE